MKKQIIIMNEGITYDVADRDDCIKAVIEEYHRFDASMCDILASIAIEGFSVEDVMLIYAKCMEISDGDTTIRFTGETNDSFCEMVERFGGIVLEDF